MGLVLFIRHAAKADFEHVQIVPPTILASIHGRSVFVYDVEKGTIGARSDTVRACCICTGTEIVWSTERVVDVAGDPPRVGNGHSPSMEVVFAPTAQAVKDRSPR